MTRVIGFGKYCATFAVAVLCLLAMRGAADAQQTAKGAKEIGTVRQIYDGALSPTFKSACWRASSLSVSAFRKKKTSLF